LILGLVAALVKLAAIGSAVAALASLSLAATVGFTDGAVTAGTSLTLALVVAMEKLVAIGSTVAALISLSSAATVGFTEDGLEDAELSATA
jgi:hypothetical protein